MAFFETSLSENCHLMIALDNWFIPDDTHLNSSTAASLNFRESLKIRKISDDFNSGQKGVQK